MSTVRTRKKESAGYLDIHTHILPGVDDGAQSMKQSIRMLRAAAMEGIAEIILTPHQKTDRRCVSPEGILRRMGLLQEEADRQRIPIRLHPGSELFYRHGIEELLETGKLITLAGSRYCLTEFFPQEDYAYICDGLSRLSASGYRPILAHAERYGQVTEGDRAAQLKRRTGCLFQVNAAALTGETGFAWKSRSRRLMKDGLVDFVATDAHDEAGRAPRMERCAAWLQKRYGGEERDRLLLRNPRAGLEDREL